MNAGPQLFSSSSFYSVCDSSPWNGSAIKKKVLIWLAGSSKSSMVAKEGTHARKEPGRNTEVESMKKCCLLALCPAPLGLLRLHSYVAQGHQPGVSTTHCAPNHSISAPTDAMQASGEKKHY